MSQRSATEAGERGGSTSEDGAGAIAKGLTHRARYPVPSPFFRKAGEDDHFPVDDTDERGRSPLLIAAEHGQTATVHELLAAGASANKADNIGYSPLWLAADTGCTNTVAALLAAGAWAAEQCKDDVRNREAFWAVKNIFGRF